MDEEQIKALIAASLEESNRTILTQIDQKNSGLASSLSRELKKSLEAFQVPAKEEPKADDEAPAKPTEEGKLTLKALQAQLSEQTKLISALKEDGDRKDRETLAASRNAALASSIAGAKTLNPSLLEKVLRLEYGDNLKSENGGWFLQSGDKVSTLNDAVASYLQTDEGKAFLPSSGTSGAGSTESKNSTPAVVTGNKAVDLLNSAFDSF